MLYAANTVTVGGSASKSNDAEVKWEAAECWAMLGPRKINIQLGPDTLLVNPIYMEEMTLVNLPKIPVPNNPQLVGVSVYVQGLLYNPLVYPNDPLKLSQGIEFEIGVRTSTYGPKSGLDIWPIGTVIAQPGGTIEIDFTIE